MIMQKKSNVKQQRSAIISSNGLKAAVLFCSNSTSNVHKSDLCAGRRRISRKPELSDTPSPSTERSSESKWNVNRLSSFDA